MITTKTITRYYFNGETAEIFTVDTPNKIKLFEIEIVVDGLTYSVYYKGGYYTVENDKSIYEKTLFSGSAAECANFIKKQFKLHNLLFCVDLPIPKF